jgi:hypothetical protein
MITRRAASTLVAGIALAAGGLVAGALPGSAAVGGSHATVTQSWTAGGLIGANPGSFPTQRLTAGVSGNGGPGFAQVGACTFYATGASAGGYCGAGYGGPHPPSLQAWLAGRPFIPCRYFDVPAGMVINAGSAPGGRWMLKACFEHVDPTQPWGGRNMIVDIFGEWVPDGKDIDIPGYMETFWSHVAHENFYPVPRISVGPTQPALVDTYTFFWASWVKAQDSTQPAEENYRIAYNTLTEGMVYLHMRVHDVVINPGVEGMDPVHCGIARKQFDTGAPDAIPRSEGGSQDSECWLRYAHSTAFRDNQTVTIHADAYWHVTVETPGGQVLRDLGDFHYAAYQRLGVAEVQTLVDW